MAMAEDGEVTYATFVHLSGGLRTTLSDEGAVRFWPFEKHQFLEITDFPADRLGEMLSKAGLRCIGNEERVWQDGYEDRFWNPALIPGLGKSVADWPGHDWAALGYAYQKAQSDDFARLSSAASFHLIGASRRLMHISEWYHQMLLYARLKGFHDRMAFQNSDHMNFLIDCHSFLQEAASARDHISAFAASAIADVKADSFSKLWEKRMSLPDKLRSIMEEASDDAAGRLTIRHIGKYRNAVVHNNPISHFSGNVFETQSFDIGTADRLLGVKFDIQVWPKKRPDVKFDALQSFHSMMRVLDEFGRKIIALSPVDPEIPVILGKAKRSHARRVSFPDKWAT